MADEGGTLMTDQGGATDTGTGDTGDQGGEPQSHFSDSFPETYREKFKDFESFDKFVEQYDTLVQGTSIPETYTDPDDITIQDETTWKQFREGYDKLSKELGLNQKQHSELLKALVKRDGAVEQARREAAEKEVAESFAEEAKETAKILKKEWGQNFDMNMNIAKKVVTSLLDQDFVEYLNESGLGNDSRLIKAFYTIGKKIGEDRFNRKTTDGNLDDVRRTEDGRPLLHFPSLEGKK